MYRQFIQIMELKTKPRKCFTFCKSGKIKNTNDNIDGTNLEKSTEHTHLVFVFTSNGPMTT